jgi:hypothetical protein
MQMQEFLRIRLDTKRYVLSGNIQDFLKAFHNIKILIINPVIATN